MSCESEELHSIAVSIMQNSKISVIIDNSLETAMTDYKNIYVTIQLVPDELRKYRRVVSRVMDGEVSHEAGHIVITAPVKQRLQEWIMRQRNPTLANIVHQSLEDKRVNHFILQRYRYDFAFRLQLLADVSNQLWLDTLKMKIEKIQNPNAITPITQSAAIKQMLIPIAAIKGLWNEIDVEKEFAMNDEQKEFVRKSKAIFDDARFDRMPMSIVARHQQLYDLWEEEVYASSEKPEDNTPKSIGGKLTMSSGKETGKLLAKLEKAFKKAEQKAEEEAKRENRKQKDMQEGMSAGTGSGLNIPTPVPYEAGYQRVVQENREHIERLLNLLKRLVKPKLITEKWRPQGRFMTEILAKAMASSNRRDIHDVYSHRTMMMEKAEACMGLLVDLSGSVSIQDAMDALTVVSEVDGRWLRDEDFAIMVFGSEYQKIKAFVEPYHTTRNRIGGLRCLGGTELYSPLFEMYKMMKAQRNSRAKVLMIVSDFYVSKPDECKKLIKTIEKDGINVVGLGIDSATEQGMKQFCKQSRYIGNITQLPEAVFDLYREAAF